MAATDKTVAKKAKSIFDHLSGIKEKKTSWESLTV